METKPGCRVHAIIVTSCHGNIDETWSTSCLIMQHKPYIVELSFMETRKLHDSINEGPSLTTEGPPQTNVVHVRTNVAFRTEFKSASNYQRVSRLSM